MCRLRYIKTVLKRLKSLIFILVLCGSVFTGTPFADTGMKKDKCPMKCCKKAKSAKPSQKDAVRLCRTLNCTNTAPTSTTSSAQMNLASLLVILKHFPAFQFLLAPPTTKNNSQPLFAETARLKTFQPKYIRNLSLLI